MIKTCTFTHQTKVLFTTCCHTDISMTTTGQGVMYLYVNKLNRSERNKSDWAYLQPHTSAMWELLCEGVERNSQSNWIWIQCNPDPNPRTSSFDLALCRLGGGRRFWRENETHTQPPANPQTGVLSGPQFTQRQMMSRILASQWGWASTDRSIQD